ncbi:MAG: RHS repeat-associated core domain-containing protein [Acutalibacteraceae bacterium]
MFKKISASLLTALFVFSQNTILAQELVGLSNTVCEKSAGELKVIGEVPEKRSEFTKHFRMSNGTMKAVVYSDQVNYKNDNGFEEIDNTLINGENDTYKNINSPLKVNLSKKFKNKNLLNIEMDGHNVSMSYIKKKYKSFINTLINKENVESNEKQSKLENDEFSEQSFEKEIKEIPECEVNAVDAKVENFDKSKVNFRNENEEKINVGKIYSKVKYENQDEKADLDYIISGLSLKENIILTNKTDSDRFDFEIKTDLSISKDENGELKFKDSSEKVIFVMPKGCMWDASDNFSDNVEYELNQISEGYIISVIPNKEWINDNARIYPITIDPSIKKDVASGINDTHISSPYPNTSYYGNSYISVGALNNSSQRIGYIKSDNFPIFSHGEMITKANLYLHPYPGANSFGSPNNSYANSPDNVVGVRELTSSWNENTTWNSKPSSKDTIQDYFKTSSSTLSSYNSWDITKIVKHWYTLDKPNSNFGVELSTTNLDLSSVLRYVSVNDSVNENKKPYFEIEYKEFVGEENYWSYKSHAAGYKGIGKVNNYAGTLSVSENVLSYSGSRNPVNIFATYNNVNYNEQANAYFHTKSIPGGYERSSFLGLGFRFSFDKVIYQLPSTDDMYLEGWKYIYIDGDGTQHYFKLDSDKLVDEDGLGLTLTENVDNGKIEIKDLKDNKLLFYKPAVDDELYVLYSQSDNNANVTTYNYSEGKISGIVDVANRVTTISYISGTNKVSKITADDGKEINFKYSGERLEEISYPDGIKTGYGYDEQGRLSKVWTNANTGSSIQYSYASNDCESLNFFKVRNITECAGTEINKRKAGNSKSFVYEMNETKITNGINNDDVPYGKETEIWQFDNDGQVTAVLDSSGNMISNIYYKEIGRRNYKIKHTNGAGKYTNNLLKNTYANRDLADWEVDNWIESNDTANNLVSIDNTLASLGTKCFKIIRNNETDAPWPILRQRVQIQKKSYDRKFTFSGDIKLSENLSDGSGASLHISSFGSNGQQMSGDEYSKWVKSETDWKRESVTINVPAGAQEIECAFGMKESIGTAYFDCLQLEESDTANDYNMVENSSFDCNLENWLLSEDSGAKVENGKLKIVGNSEINQKVSQEIFINKENAVFAVRANSQGTSVPNKENSGVRYCIECVLNFEDNISKSINVLLNPDVSEEQSVYASIAPIDYGYNKKVKSIVVSPCFDKNLNTVYFDNIQICVDDNGINYDLNDNGIPTKITNNTGDCTEYTLNSDNEITQVKNGTQNQVNCNYGDTVWKHRVTDYTVQQNGLDVKTGLNYDINGNLLSSSTRNANETGKKIEESVEYTQNKNYVNKQIDCRGKTTEFTVNESNGNVTKTKNSKEVETGYAYDNADRLVSEICGASQTLYSYMNGAIASISHKVSEGTNTVYNFVRDMFGNIGEVKIGNRTLAKNTYDSGNGLIRQMKYGNEQTINYDYDDKGRVVKKSFGYEKGNKFGEIIYSYDTKGRVYKIYDSLNDLTIDCLYDRYGRLLRANRSDSTSSEIKYSSHNSLIEKVTSNIFGIQTVLNNTFGKLDTLLNSEINVGDIGVISKYDYNDDTLGRLSNTEVVNSDNTSGIKHEFTYHDLSESIDKTTNLISSIEIKKKVSDGWTSIGEKFNYTYDDLGNITDIRDMSNNLIAHYEYDYLNQLVRENNVQSGKTVTYQYNDGGNLTEKKMYSYTVDADLSNATLESSTIYNYADLNWPDKLTSITTDENEEEFIYDAIGNPLEYRDGWKFEWSRGKRLDKMGKTGYNVNVSFKYDDAGVRTQKIINGVQTDFITLGIKVLAQKTGNNTIIWQIDGNGNTVGFNYNGMSYLYLKNLQGDIIGITDIFGNVVAKYTYDSWGRLISIKDASDVDKTADTAFIGYINPLRYRGYYYDSETGLYYLNARYYDPEVGRFISADETLDGGYNLFAYCYNNPIRLIDSTGCMPGDQFDTIDQAAEDFGRCFNGPSINLNKEFASGIYVLPNGKYSYTNPQIGGKADLNIEYEMHITLNAPYCLVNGHYYPMVAAIHSHGAYVLGASSDNFSGDDIEAADTGFMRPLYLVSPNGHLQRYDNSTHTITTISTTMPRDPNYGEVWLGFKRIFI